MGCDSQPRGATDILQRVVDKKGVIGRNLGELQHGLKEGWIGLSNT